MTLQRYRPASFRGVPFLVGRSDRAGGRRVHEHIFPQRDDQLHEDLGRAPRHFRLDAHVSGGTWDLQRDALIAVLEAPGPGTLQHPWHGRRVVSVLDFSQIDNASRAGVADFSITFAEAGDALLPDIVADFSAGLLGAVDGALTGIETAFGAVFNLTGLPDFIVGEALDLGADLLGAAGETIGGLLGNAVEAASFVADLSDIAGNLSTLILTPATLAGRVTGLIRRTVDIAAPGFGDPEAAARALLGLSPAALLARFPIPALADAVQTRNHEALTGLVGQACLATAGQLATEISFASVDDASAFRASLVTGLNAAIATAGNVGSGPADQGGSDALFQVLMTLRAAAVKHITHSAADLPKLTTETLPQTGPSVVAAWRLYGDAGRADEIVARNRGLIGHPGFAPGGQALEVLNR